MQYEKPVIEDQIDLEGELRRRRGARGSRRTPN